MTRPTLLLTVLILAGCGGGENFEPDGVSLAGTWLISSEQTPF